jgi:hypothetical protein
VEFKALDVESLAATLGTLSDDATVDSRGVSSRSEYLSRFTPAESASNLLRIYTDAGKNFESS